MQATVISTEPFGMISLRLWTGQVIKTWRSLIPVQGPLKVGDELEVVVKAVPLVVEAKKKPPVVAA